MNAPLRSPPVVVRIPGLKLVSEANEHTHYRERQKRALAQRAAVAAVLARHAPPAPPAVVTIIRIAPSRLDTDNLTGSAKHVRDAVAEWFGIDDRSPLVVWQVRQRRGAPGEYGVEIRVRAWRPEEVGARVSLAGETTLTEVTLGPAVLTRLSAALARLATAALPEVRVRVDDVELVLRRAGACSEGEGR